MAVQSSGLNVCTTANCTPSVVKPISLVPRLLTIHSALPLHSTCADSSLLPKSQLDAFVPGYAALHGTETALPSNRPLSDLTALPSVKNNHFYPILLTTPTSTFAGYTEPTNSDQEGVLMESPLGGPMPETVTPPNNLITTTATSGTSTDQGASLISCSHSLFISPNFGKGSSAPIIISSQSAAGQSAFTLRFTTGGSLPGSSVAPNTVMSSGCPLVLEASILESHNATVPIRPTVPALASPSLTPAASPCLLMTPDVSSSPRFVIQKQSNTPQALRPIVAADSTSFSTVTTIDGSTNAKIPFSDQLVSNADFTPPKTKYVNLSSPTSAGVRLLTSNPKLLAATTTSGLFQSISLAAKTPVIANPSGTMSGPTKIQAVNPPCYVAVPHSQPVLVKPLPESSNTAIDQMSTLARATVPPTWSTTGSHLYATSPTVLAFSLTSAVSPTSIPTPSSLPLQASVAKQHGQNSPNSPVVLRANYAAPASYAPHPSSSASSTSASLLKPFNLSVSTMSAGTPNILSTAVSGVNTTTLPHAISVNTTAPKLPSSSSSSSLPATCQSPTSVASLIRTHSGIAVSPHRHVTASLVSQANRKRARKQQLASAPIGPALVASLAVPVSSSCGTDAVPTCTPMSLVQCSTASTTVSRVESLSVPQHFQTAVLSPALPVSLSGLTKSNQGFQVAATPSVDNAVPVNTGAPGIVGIRLLSIRPSSSISSTVSAAALASDVSESSSLASLQSVGQGGSASVGLLGAFSSTASSCFTQLAHNSLPADHPSNHPPTTVYVLASSNYPIVTGASTTGTGTQGLLPRSSQPASYTMPSALYAPTVVTVPGGSTGSLVQVRIRSPFSTIPGNNSSPMDCSPVWVESQSRGGTTLSPAIPTNSNSVPQSSFGCSVTDVINKPRTCSEVSSSKYSYHSSNSLLHRHLVSPQTSLSYESLPTGSPVVIASESNENLPFVHGFDRSSCLISTAVEHHGICKQHNPVSADTFPKGSPYIDTKLVFRRTRRTSDMINIPDEPLSTDSGASCQPTKRSKLYDELPCRLGEPSEPEVKCSRADPVVVTPADTQLPGSCFPTKPPIVPRLSYASRNGTTWRAKASHFLSFAEIREKRDSRFDKMQTLLSDSPERSGIGDERSALVSRRRRRVTTRRVADEQLSSTNENTSSRTMPATQRRLLHDWISLVANQRDLQFVNFPLPVASVLSLSGWRTLSCIGNLDLLLSTEDQALQSIDSLVLKLDDMLDAGAVTPSTYFDVSHFREGRAQVSGSIPSSSGHATASCLDRASSPERISTASVLSSLSTVARPPYLAPDARHKILEALELAKGVAQRTRFLHKSIQRLQNMTRDVVEHFRANAVKHADAFEEQYENLLSNSVLRSARLTDTNRRASSLSLLKRVHVAEQQSGSSDQHKSGFMSGLFTRTTPKSTPQDEVQSNVFNGLPGDDDDAPI